MRGAMSALEDPGAELTATELRAASACRVHGVRQRRVRVPILARVRKQRAGHGDEGEIIPEWRAKSSRNAERYQIGMVGDII